MSRMGLRKLKSYQEKHGTSELVKKVVSRICSFVFSYMPLDFYSFSGALVPSLQSRCPLEIRKGSWDDIGLIVDFHKDINVATARKRAEYLFANGGKPFLAFSKGKLTHISWLFYPPGIRESHFTVKIRDGEAYIGTCYTSPEFRGENIYPVVIQYIVGYAVRENIRRFFISAAPTNTPSIKGVVKAGFSKIGRLRIFRLFGKFFNNQWVSSDAIKFD